MQCKSSDQRDTCSYSGKFLPVVVAGSVDHGKSTLLGRLLMDLDQISPDRVEFVKAICKRKGIVFEPGFLLDALEEEQSQGISIDTTRVRVDRHNMSYLFIDVPGHEEFLRNMATGACEAQVGILMIDASEGLKSRTTVHARILAFMGIKQIICVINKIDRYQYNQQVFQDLCRKATELLAAVSLPCSRFVPVSALLGDNLVAPSENMPWYTGPSFISAVNECRDQLELTHETSQPFRLLLQDVYKFDDHRYYVGKIVSGSISQGEEILFMPSERPGKIKEFKVFPAKEKLFAEAGESIAVALEEQIFVERGEVATRPYESPEVSDRFVGNILWLSNEPLTDRTSPLLLKLGTAEVACKLIPVSFGDGTEQAIVNGTFFDAILCPEKPVVIDVSSLLPALNRFVLCTEYGTVAAGMVTRTDDTRIALSSIDENVPVEHGYLSRDIREARQGHRGAVLWLTGLSGSGKSTIAKALEHKLFNKDIRVGILDADNVRNGLCSDLGFSSEARSENIRRLAHVAKQMVELGMVVVVACLSPYARDRRAARKIIGADFFEIHLDCSLEMCMSRDPKGLYGRAKSGQVRAFSGLNSPYQRPVSPSLRIDTSTCSLEQGIEQIVDLMMRSGILSQNK